ncbi:MAG TPA: phosphoglycerate kinase [Candidatus Paceibacterota bacterium]|nr:phosphoglycerate kinase [Candidatus Paceibacterota bacterium]
MHKGFPLMTAHADLFKGKRVLLRLDLNVPLALNTIRSDFRIRASLPTLNFLRTHGARVIILSHIGKGDPKDSLRPIAEYLSRMMPLLFLDRFDTEANKRVVDAMNDGDVVMLENLRLHAGEKDNSPEFAAELAALGDYYVNDGFAVSHRAHASIVGVPALLPSFAGMRFAEEAAELSRVFDPQHPFLFIMGGTKVATKLPLLQKLSKLADHIFVGGVVANDFLKAKGYNVGCSICDTDMGEELLAISHDPKLITPMDVVVKGGGGNRTALVDDILDGEMVADIGRETVTALEQVLGESKLVVWNGPLGFYEEGYTDGSRELLERILGSNAYAILGGGDTVALVESMGSIERFGFVSTGGGAMLEYLANETLPGLDALRGLPA